MAATAQIEGATSSAGKGFVGRGRELAAFSDAFDRMLAGRRQVLTLAGEPGVGKTRLAEAFGDTAENQGAVVLWGRCFEEQGAPPYWPWVQILREFVDASSESELRRLVGSDAQRLVALVPELASVLGIAENNATAPPDAGQARFLAFDAVSRMLRRAAEQVPIVLIIDNAHWSDKPSLALLEHASRELANSRALLVCTYRDTEIGRDNPLLETLGIFGAGNSVARLRLTGLEREAIAALAELVLGKPLSPEIVTEIDQQTDGNPLFVIELLKVLIDESRQAGAEPIEVRVPEGVREAIGRRLSRLSSTVNHLLRVASVFGRHFEEQALVKVAAMDIEAVLAGLDSAAAAGFVEYDTIRDGRRFTHALIRETLYDEIPTPDRLRLHGLAGDALASFHPEPRQQSLSQIAHHYFEAAPLGHVDKAVDFAIRAGHEAMRLDAYEVALAQYDRVIRLSEQHALDGPERRQAVLWKSRALLGTGDICNATDILMESIGDGSTIEDAQWLADVATQWAFLQADEMQVRQLPVLRQLLELLPQGDSASRAKVMAALALAERTLGNVSQVHSRVEEAIAMARRADDAPALRHCLRSAMLALAGNPATLETRLALGAEFIARTPAGDNSEWLAQASYQQAFNLLEAGRIDELETLLDNYERLDAAGIGLHEHRTRSFRVMLALLRGEYAGLEAKLEELRETGRKTVRNIAEGVYGAQMFALQRDLGTLEEFVPMIESFAAAPRQKAWTPGLMICLAETGNLDAARREFERLAQNDFRSIPADDLRLTTLIYCAETCCLLGDAEAAGQLIKLLEPHAGTFASHPTVACFGSTDLYLGMLSASSGDRNEAESFFAAAIRANTAARAWPWLARSNYQYGRFLSSSDDAETRRSAEQFLREAEQLAGDLGMQGLATETGKALRGDCSGDVYPDGLTAREIDVLRLMAIGRSNKDIGKVLSISLNTVATHVRNILVKTECANRTEAAGYASRNQLVETK
tara:strand:+ start:1569 stop:4526 length:2958 start_codon:yes stop_codon:yes gene_type:complete